MTSITSSYKNDTDYFLNRFREHINSIIAGAVSGAAGTLVGHPLDTLKVRLQLEVNTTISSNTTVANIKPLSSAIVQQHTTLS